MAKDEQEVEVKFYVRDLRGLEQRLQQQGAVLEAERVRERNLRFDTPDQKLRNTTQVLRLRQDAKIILTYKGAPNVSNGTNARQEIELEVNDFGAARRFLGALGYVVSTIYEKFRTTYRFKEVLVTLDEMPYGNFAEIEYSGEGEPTSAIRSAADALHLDWEARVIGSYIGLFESLRDRKHLEAYHLTFDELKGITITPQDLGLRYAD